MKEYHKIQTVFLRDPKTKFKTLLQGHYAKPEFDYLSKNFWRFTEKVDGTNIRVMYDGENIRFGGKTDRAEIPKPLLSRMNDKFDIGVFKRVFSDATEVCLYGEGYGPKIQKGGGNYRQDQDFVLFDINIHGWWLKWEDVVDIASKLSIDVVPTIKAGTILEMVELVQAGFDSSWGAFRAEGVVARPLVELMSRNGERIITKLKCKDFRK